MAQPKYTDSCGSILNLSMLVSALLIGATVGLSVVAFIKLFAFVHNLCFSGKLSFFYNETQHTLPSVLGWGIILVPVFGSLIVTWIIQRFAAGHGGLSISEIIYSIHFTQGDIRPVSAFAKAVASIITIGSGGSLGREGPIAQLSAAFSALIGDMMRITGQQKVVLIAAGAAAGTAVIFKAPIAGLAFAIEILLISVNGPSIAVIILAETIAILIGSYFLGYYPIVSIPNLEFISVQSIFYKQLLLFIPFGIIIGFCSVLFIRGMYFTEDVFIKYFKSPYLRHATGMLGVGIMIAVLMHYFGKYYIEGVGLATIQDILNFIIKNPWLLVSLFVFKILASFLTLGSGASGGIFSPSLFMGATLGGLYGIVSNHFISLSEINLLSYVVAGMAAMLAGVSGGIITAIILCIEITKDYQHILPILITTVIAFWTRRRLCRENIYTLKLIRRNVNLQEKIQY